MPKAVAGRVRLAIDHEKEIPSFGVDERKRRLGASLYAFDQVRFQRSSVSARLPDQNVVRAQGRMGTEFAHEIAQERTGNRFRWTLGRMGPPGENLSAVCARGSTCLRDVECHDAPPAEVIVERADFLVIIGPDLFHAVIGTVFQRRPVTRRLGPAARQHRGPGSLRRITAPAVKTALGARLHDRGDFGQLAGVDPFGKKRGICGIKTDCDHSPHCALSPRHHIHHTRLHPASLQTASQCETTILTRRA